MQITHRQYKVGGLIGTELYSNKFIDGYLETGDKRDLKELVNSNILKIFIPMLTVKTFNIIKNIVKKRVKNY